MYGNDLDVNPYKCRVVTKEGKYRAQAWTLFMRAVRVTTRSSPPPRRLIIFTKTLYVPQHPTLSLPPRPAPPVLFFIVVYDAYRQGGNSDKHRRGLPAAVDGGEDEPHGNQSQRHGRVGD